MINHYSPQLRHLFLSFILLSFSASYSQVQTPRYIQTATNSNAFYEYLPKGYSATNSQKYPLLIFSHGSGENGDGSPAQLPRVLVHGTPQQINQGIFPDSFLVNGQIFRYIVISPQYTKYPAESDIQQILDYAVAHYNVDTNRIYLTGLSQGGGIIFRYCGYSLTYARRIAAIVTVAQASYPTPSRVQNIGAANIAVWATHNDGDPNVPVLTTTIAFVNQINALPTPPNPLAKKTIFQSNTHDSWTQTYDLNFKEDNLNIYEWMLQYSKANGTLAITGLNFYVTLEDNGKVLLSWQTSSETNNKGFVIERSMDGNSFDSINFVASASIGGRGADYNFTTGAINGISYYRLKEIDYDGSYTYSPVRFVKFNTKNLLEVYPNPVWEEMHIRTSISLHNAEMKIFNVQGKMMMEKIINGNGLIDVSVQGLPAGIYIAKIISDGQEQQFRFIKN